MVKKLKLDDRNIEANRESQNESDSNETKMFSKSTDVFKNHQQNHWLHCIHTKQAPLLQPRLIHALSPCCSFDFIRNGLILEQTVNALHTNSRSHVGLIVHQVSLWWTQIRGEEHTSINQWLCLLLEKSFFRLQLECIIYALDCKIHPSILCTCSIVCTITLLHSSTHDLEGYDWGGMLLNEFKKVGI